MNRPWKEASTIILTVLKNSPINTNGNYQLLTLQRSSKSSFMPNGYVFPGGVTETSDGDKMWLDFFSYFNLDLSSLTKLTGKIPPIIENETGHIPKLLSLKITAIRETFEETGILLCFNKQKSADSQKWVSYSLFQNLDSWRAKVQKNPKDFFNMCENYECCPDIRNLHLWSNWLTPTSMGQKRFDTAFFIACLNESPKAVANKSEVEKLIWIGPDGLMKLCENKDIWLPPPQVYETARLLQFKDINDLNNFALDRFVQGCERWMPKQIKTSDGMVSVLPGDDAYKSSNYCTPTKPDEVKMSFKQFRDQSNVLHRMEFLDEIKTRIIVKNYKPTNGHVLPVGEC